MEATNKNVSRRDFLMGASALGALGVAGGLLAGGQEKAFAQTDSATEMAVVKAQELCSMKQQAMAILQ